MMQLLENFGQKAGSRYLRNNPGIIWLEMLIITGITTGFFILTRTNLITEDSMSYAASIVKGSLVDLFHPHHLLYNLVLAIPTRLFFPEKIGTISALQFLQFLNALVAGSAAGLMFWWLQKWGKISKLDALLLTSLLVFSFSFWQYSTQIEVYTLSALFLILAWSLFEKGSRLVWLPLIFAIFFHQTAIFLMIAFVVESVLRRKPWRYFFWILILPMVLVGGAYVAATGLVYHKIPTLVDLWNFTTAYAQTGYWGKVSWLQPLKLMDGFATAFFPVDDYLTKGRYALILLALLPFLGLLFVAFRNWKTQAGRASFFQPWPPLRLVLIWLAGHLLFVFWWYPNNLEFYIPVLPAVFILFTRLPKSGLYFAIFGTFLVLEIGLNGFSLVPHRHSTNLAMEYTQGVCLSLTGNDLVITSGLGARASYLDFFCNSRVLSLNDLAYKNKAAHDLTGIVLQGLHKIISGTLGNVIMTSEVTNQSIFANRSLKTLQFQQLADFLGRYTWKEKSVGNDHYFVMTR